VAVTLTWYAGWIALEAVSVAGALLLTAWSLWLLRQDRFADYQRSLVPWVTVRVGDYDASYQYIPLEVTALGNGTAYNVIVNLFQKHPPGGAFFIAEPVLPQLSAGEHEEVRIDMVSPPFAGQLEVGYFDPAGGRHVAWHSVNAAVGFLRRRPTSTGFARLGASSTLMERRAREAALTAIGSTRSITETACHAAEEAHVRCEMMDRSGP
jgi:hypothetical protein